MLSNPKFDLTRAAAPNASFLFPQGPVGDTRSPIYIKDRCDLIERAHGIRDKARELVLAIFVDDTMKVLEQKIVSVGTASEAIVDFRLIIAIAYAVRAKGFFLAHNHPSGNARPSASDLSLTKRLYQTTDACDLAFVAHAIVSLHDEYVIDLNSGSKFPSNLVQP